MLLTIKLLPWSWLTSCAPVFEAIISDRAVWTSALTTHTAPGWGALRNVSERFAVAFALNSFKAKLSGSVKPALFQNTERIRLMAYMEAFCEDTADFLKATWGGSTVPQAPTTIPAMYLPSQSTSQPPAATGSAASPPPTLYDLIAKLITQDPTETWAKFSAVITSAQALDAQREHLRNSQFTFIFTIAKKGDATQRFTTKAVRGMQTELGIDSVDIYAQELNWICQKVMRTSKLTDHIAWAALFNTVEVSMKEVERVHTVITWAKEAGTTKLQFVKRAYKKFGSFDWVALERVFPGQLLKAHQMNRTLKAEPYRAFYSAGNEALVWEPTAFMDVAHVCWMLLDVSGDASVTGYKGFSTHNLDGEEFWRRAITTYLLNYQTRKVGDLVTDAANERRIDTVDLD